MSARHDQESVTRTVSRRWKAHRVEYVAQQPYASLEAFGPCTVQSAEHAQLKTNEQARAGTTSLRHGSLQNRCVAVIAKS